MSINDKVKCLTLLASLQTKTSPINLTIGTTFDGIVNHDFIVITDCSQYIIEQLLKHDYMLSLSEKGLIVNKI